jgi:beta-phosphoglucomutase
MRALLVDFNGTLSEDEPILCRIFQELFADAGKPLSEDEYYGQLAGFSDREVIRMWLGRDDEAILDRKVSRYRELADGSTVGKDARDAVRLAAESVEVAVVSGSSRAEIEPVLDAAGIRQSITLIVSEEDVARSKPDPEGYLIALHLLGFGSADGTAVEDSPAGVAAAKAAGLRCIGVTTSFGPDRLSQADELADRFDRDLIAALLSSA